VRAYETPLSLF